MYIWAIKYCFKLLIYLFGDILIFFHSGGIALTSFTIKYGLIPVVFSMAVTHGVAFGLIYAQAIGSVIKWFLKDNKGWHDFMDLFIKLVNYG